MSSCEESCDPRRGDEPCQLACLCCHVRRDGSVAATNATCNQHLHSHTVQYSLTNRLDEVGCWRQKLSQISADVNEEVNLLKRLSSRVEEECREQVARLSNVTCVAAHRQQKHNQHAATVLACEWLQCDDHQLQTAVEQEKTELENSVRQLTELSLKLQHCVYELHAFCTCTADNIEDKNETVALETRVINLNKYSKNNSAKPWHVMNNSRKQVSGTMNTNERRVIVNKVESGDSVYVGNSHRISELEWQQQLNQHHNTATNLLNNARALRSSVSRVMACWLNRLHCSRDRTETLFRHVKQRLNERLKDLQWHCDQGERELSRIEEQLGRIEEMSRELTSDRIVAESRLSERSRRPLTELVHDLASSALKLQLDSNQVSSEESCGSVEKLRNARHHLMQHVRKVRANCSVVENSLNNETLAQQQHAHAQ